MTTSGRGASRYRSENRSDSPHLAIGCRGNTASTRRGRFGHPPGIAIWAETVALATERDRPLSPTGVALSPKKSVFEQAALQLCFELVFHILQQRSPLSHPPIRESGIVFGHMTEVHR